MNICVSSCYVVVSSCLLSFRFLTRIQTHYIHFIQIQKTENWIVSIGKLYSITVIQPAVVLFRCSNGSIAVPIIAHNKHHRILRITMRRKPTRQTKWNEIFIFSIFQFRFNYYFPLVRLVRK